MARRRTGRLGPDFAKLFVASTASNLGDGVGFVALPWLASTLTRDPVLVAGLPMAMVLPWFLVSLPAGALIDRTDRRRLMTSVAALRSAVALVLVVTLVTGTLTLPLLYGAALLLGTGEVLFDSAAQAVLPAIVERGELERANGHIWAGQMICDDLGGRPLGGLLTSAAPVAPFAFLGLVTATAAAAMARVRGVSRPAAVEGHGLAGFVADLRVGVGWLLEHRPLRSLALIVGGSNLGHAAATATFVLFAQEILDLSATGFGVLLSMSAVGGLAGSQAARWLSARFGPGTTLQLSLAGSVLGFAGVALSSDVLVVGALLALWGFTAIVWNVLTVSLRQSVVPQELLGRVNSVYRFLGRGALPVGTLLGGVLVSVVEPLLGRTAGLRAPLLATALLYGGLLVAARWKLGNARLRSLQPSG